MRQIPCNAKIIKPDMKLKKHSIVIWLRKFLFSKGCRYCCLACVFECEVFLQRCKNLHQNLLTWHCGVKFSWKSKCRLGLSNLSKWPVKKFMTQQKYQIHQFLNDPHYFIMSEILLVPPNFIVTFFKSNYLFIDLIHIKY